MRSFDRFERISMNKPLASLIAAMFATGAFAQNTDPNTNTNRGKAKAATTVTLGPAAGGAPPAGGKPGPASGGTFLAVNLARPAPQSAASCPRSDFAQAVRGLSDKMPGTDRTVS